jgi:prepilin-type N-terminal cleavage/methylation domain-containing protein
MLPLRDIRSGNASIPRFGTADADRIYSFCVLNTSFPKNCPRSRATAVAFSLIEVLVGTAIIGIVFVSTYLCISQSVRVTDMARYDLRATQILNEKMEIMRLYTWNQITNGTSIPTKFTNRFYTLGANNNGASYTGRVTLRKLQDYAGDEPELDSDYGNLAPFLRKVIVRVTWVSPGSTKVQTRRISTLVSSNGLQTYIY